MVYKRMHKKRVSNKPCQQMLWMLSEHIIEYVCMYVLFMLNVILQAELVLSIVMFIHIDNCSKELQPACSNR